jgi:hypothetical protein
MTDIAHVYTGEIEMTRKKARTVPKGSINLYALERETKKLLALLKDRRTDLPSWNILLLRQVENLRKLLEVKAQKRTPPEVTKKEVLKKAIEVFEGRKDATWWLTREAIALGEQTPASLLSTPSGCKKVMNHLARIQYAIS